jgi:hypothetical protein
MEMSEAVKRDIEFFRSVAPTSLRSLRLHAGSRRQGN